jgi:diguanylate cyclase (GGDEF)-like protein
MREINNRFGHLAGGRVLRRLGEYLNQHLRRIDIPARIGGDEFVNICPETPKLMARVLAERLRQDLSKWLRLLELRRGENGNADHYRPSEKNQRA